MTDHTFRFCLQENELSPVLIRTVPLGCARELLFEWSHLKVSLDSPGILGSLIASFNQIRNDRVNPEHKHGEHSKECREF